MRFNRLMVSLVLVGLVPGIALAQEKDAGSASATPTFSAQQEVIANSPVQGDSYWGNTGVDPVLPMLNPPTSVDGVLSNSILREVKKKDEISFVRAQSIQEGAAAFGAQAGMNARSTQLNMELKRNAGNYDRVFNFSSVMLEPGFLPPVISEGRDAISQTSDFVVRASDRVYKIEFPARLVSTPPRWQSYLFLSEIPLTPPDRSIIPKTSAEKELWDQWAAKGWDQGVAMADETFRSNNGRLKRDFEGMLRFKALYNQGLVTKPILNKTNLGVTGGDDQMAINDRIYEVTERSKLDPNRSRWSTPAPKTSLNDLPKSKRVESEN